VWMHIAEAHPELYQAHMREGEESFAGSQVRPTWYRIECAYGYRRRFWSAESTFSTLRTSAVLIFGIFTSPAELST
jgi:hypothetical protein